MLAICWEDGCPNHIHMLTHFEDTFTAHAMPSLHARHSMPDAPEVHLLQSETLDRSFHIP